MDASGLHAGAQVQEVVGAGDGLRATGGARSHHEDAQVLARFSRCCSY